MKKEDFETLLGVLFIICFGLGAGYYANKYYGGIIDFERKLYIPFEFKGEMYLINSKNGKTYILEKKENNKYVWYNYKFVAKTKSKKIKIYEKEDKAPFELFNGKNKKDDILE